MTGHTGGTLDTDLEPVLPAPELVVLGQSAVADALTALGPILGFRLRTSLEGSATDDVWVVVAGMSSAEDHPAARVALERGAPYVGMVASRRRAEAFLAELRADGLPEEVTARLKAPAGLDIGAATGPEIALSIVAEVVHNRRRLGHPASRVRVTLPASATDPICGMDIEIATAKWTAERDGQTYYFCAPACRKVFLATPVAG